VNVLHIDEQRTWRGGEQQASWLMAGLAAQGHRITIAGRAGSPFLLAPHGGAEIDRIALPFLNEADPITAARLAAIIRGRRIDIIHAHTSHAHLQACLARAFARRGRVVVSRRVSFVPKPGPLNGWKYSMPDIYLAVSARVGEVLLEYGLPRHQVEVVYSSIDFSRTAVPAISRQELEVPEDALLLFSAGALVDHKDHATLLAALPPVLARHPNTLLLIAGEGKLRGALETQIAASGLGLHVRLLGHRTDVPAILRSSDLYVSSSWSEGLGTSVLEALACGIPVVATEAGGVGEMVLPGKTGLLVPARNPATLSAAMLEALDNPEQAQARAAQGKAHVEANFTTPRMVENTLRVYRRLLESAAADA
jgi:glycosyltransferase involved in cell wall biosynthesis